MLIMIKLKVKMLIVSESSYVDYKWAKRMISLCTSFISPIFRFTYQQTEFRLMPNQMEMCNYNPNMVWLSSPYTLINAYLSGKLSFFFLYCIGNDSILNSIEQERFSITCFFPSDSSEVSSIYSSITLRKLWMYKVPLYRIWCM